MKKRILSLCLSLFLLLSLMPAVSAADSADYGWPEMQGDIAMRVVKDGAEVNRLIVGESYRLQFWLQNIGPYTITLPLAWDPNVVTIVDPGTGTPVSGGRKNDGEATGFRVGSKCYESDYDLFTYEPLYWNGRPVYSAGTETEGAYPSIDRARGCYRLCYYVNAPNPPKEAQMFLELSFRVDAKGDPDFHIGTASDGAGRYDPAEPDGLSVVLPNGDEGAQYVSYGTDVKCPELQVMTQAEYDAESSKSNSDIEMGGGSGQTGQTQEQKKPEIAVTLVESEHLRCFPYDSALVKHAVLKHIDGKVTQESDCILPENLISEGVNQSSQARSILVKMPEKIIPKDEYALVFNLSHMDDMADSGLSMLYVETPWAFVGLNTAILANQTADSAQARLCVRPLGVGGMGLQVTMEVDGEPVPGFTGAVMRVIMPFTYEPEAGELLVPTSGDVYNSGEVPGLPLSLHKLDTDHDAVIFLSPSFGYFNLEIVRPVTFSDLSGVPWAAEAVTSLAQRQILRGVGDERFDPNASVTREQFATMLVTAFGMYSAVADSTFSDVPETAWYTHSVNSAAASGLVSGLGGDRFGTGRTITRQDLAVMAYRALKQLGIELPKTRSAIRFSDDADIAGYASEAVYALYQAGIISGASEDTFAPNAPASRAQAARILYGAVALTGQVL